MTQYTLRLSFDLRQVTQTLAYSFVKPGNKHYHKHVGGPLAGTFNFQKGDEVFVEVVAASAASLDVKGTTPKDILKAFTVTDCTFVSIPARMTELLSPFDGSSAVSRVSEWAPAKPPQDPQQDQQQDSQNMLRLCQRSTKPLPVTTKNGQWQISGYLSVELTAMDGSTHAQLYFFDPEGSTGNGGGAN